LRYGSTSIGGPSSARPNNRIPGRAAVMRGRAVPDVWTTGQGAACENVQSPGCVTAENANPPSAPSIGVSEGGVLLDAGGWQFRAFTPTAYGRTTQRLSNPELIRTCLFPNKPFDGRPGRIRRRGRTAPRSAARIFRWRLYRRGDHAGTNDALLTISPASMAPITRPESNAHQTKITAKGEYRPDAGGRSTRYVFWGRRHRLQAQRDWPSQIPPTRPRSAIRQTFNQQGAGSPGRSAVDAVQSAFLRR